MCIDNLRAVPMKLRNRKFNPKAGFYCRKLEPNDMGYQEGKYIVLKPFTDGREPLFGIIRDRGGVLIVGNGIVCSEEERLELLETIARSEEARVPVQHVWIDQLDVDAICNKVV